MSSNSNVRQHLSEIEENVARLRSKSVLREIYRGFHREMRSWIPEMLRGRVVELGSGVADIREVIPNCVRTDLFARDGIDQLENAYQLSFVDESVDAILMFDVFHHFRYPGDALSEIARVLRPGGRVIMFEPCVSVLGKVVYGLFHHEPLGLKERIHWTSPSGWDARDVDYYAAQGNAWRVFIRGEVGELPAAIKVVNVRRYSAISYVLSGGYSKPQLYPARLLGVMRKIDSLCDCLPGIFSTRMLVVLQKWDG